MVVDTRKSNFGLWLSIVVMVSDVVHLILYYKMRKMSLQNATATVFYYKIHQVFYSKMQQLLQNETFITKWVGTKVMKKWAEIILRKRQKD